MQENYLAKWLNNELSPEELAKFESSSEFASYKKIATSSTQLRVPDFDVDGAWDTFKERKTDSTTKVLPLQPFKPFLRVAAVVALVMGSVYFYIRTGTESIATQMAQQTEVILPDASEVFLNAASELSFKKRDWDNNREVVLQGEAFFKVAKGQRFTVTTDFGNVTVLGTQFNVESRAGFFEVSCYEGAVGVALNGVEEKLTAGDSFLVINGEIRRSSGLSAVAPSWTQSESAFKSIPLKYVLAEFGRQFDVEIKTENIDTDQLFTGAFNNTDINLALESISTPSQILYELEGSKVLFYAENMP